MYKYYLVDLEILHCTAYMKHDNIYINMYIQTVGGKMKHKDRVGK